jgi:FlaA1/EpsC-like NDP-sugar epimerase
MRDTSRSLVGNHRGPNRGIRPEFRFGLLVADFGLFLAAVTVAAKVVNAPEATAGQLFFLVLIFFVCGAYIQFNYESARTFDLFDVLRLLVGAMGGAILAAAFVWLIPSPISHLSGRLVMTAAMLGFVLRMFARIGLVFGRTWILTRRPNAQRVVIVGIGLPAVSLVRAIQEDRDIEMVVAGCIDDGVTIKRIDGVPILGHIEDLPRVCSEHRVSSVIVAVPAAPLPMINRVKELCASVDGQAPTVKVMPDTADLLNERVTISRIRDIRLEDVLDREPVVIDTVALRPHLEHQVVLVTGAGGSIGSELCRQIATFDPKLLLLVGHGENSLFAIDQELRNTYNFTRTKLLLADVGDATAIRSIFSQYDPRLVFHAAAHKHVPILEENICEAVRNNILGTRTVALAASAHGTAKFVLLSTDKAVNPTSVMGLTKRMAELVCQSFAGGSSTEFVTVRFGNVLGSRGSVVPTFKQQVASGGPVTITHRDMKRYFMTIPEAVSLVLQAMSMGRDGEVFVLDMGDPIRIIDLAENIVRLCGLRPYQDIQIVETAMRPGEKLFEEIFTNSEDFTRTSHQRLLIAKQDRLDYAHLGEGIMRLSYAVRTGDWRDAVDVMSRFVPDYVADERLRTMLEVPRDGAVAPPKVHVGVI